MLKRMTDTIYGMLYRNGRYDEGNWMVHFFATKRERESAYKQAGQHPGMELRRFEFRLEQVVGEEIDH